MSDASPPRLRQVLVVIAVTAGCLSLGRIVGATWLQELVDALSAAGLEPTVTDPTTVPTAVWLTAAVFSSCGVAGAGVAALLARLRDRPVGLVPYLRAVGIALLGANLGIGGKAVAMARLAVPKAVERSAAGEPLALDLAELSLWPWALAGVFCAAFLHATVGGIAAVLADPDD